MYQQNQFTLIQERGLYNKEESIHNYIEESMICSYCKMEEDCLKNQLQQNKEKGDHFPSQVDHQEHKECLKMSKNFTSKGQREVT